ncbi:MAG TPA: octanoyltransferase [Gammaproteobacteria bacterium]|nr:octanoyltransferase [Gammaproteobacteria bacterium]
MDKSLTVRCLGMQDYRDVWQAMLDFTTQRTADSASEIWIVEHPPVFTQGQAGKAEHLLDAGDIPVVQSDRGGQVTYHGPGQLVCYLLLDLKEIGMGIRSLVNGIEEATIQLLSEQGIAAARKPGAPGVYVDGAKIAAIGLRVKKQRTYHGLSLNVNMDLQPFSRINPCGFPGLAVTDLATLGVDTDVATAAHKLTTKLAAILGYTLTET